MKKVFTKIAGLSVGLALAIGVGVAVGSKEAKVAKATDVAFKTITFGADAGTTTGSSGYGSETEAKVWNYECDSLGLTITNFNNNSWNNNWTYIKAGSKNYASVASVATSTALSAAITKVSINVGALSATNVNSVTLYSGSSVGATTTNHGEFAKSTGVKEVSISSPTSNLFYTIVVDCKKSSNGVFQLNSIVFYHDVSAVSPTSISCNPQSVSVASKLSLADAVTFEPAGTTEKGLSFTLKSGSEYAELTEAGVITGKKGGSAVVTITPQDTSAGATAIDVVITVNSLPAPSLTIGDQYVIYNAEAKRELTGIASNNIGTATTYTGDVPSCTYVLTAEEGFYENTVAFSDGTKYLSLNSAANNLYLSNAINEKSSWVVSVVEEVLTIVSVAYPDRQIQYNASSGQERFACYTGTQTAISLYHYEESALTDFTIESIAGVYVSGTTQIKVTYTPADAADKQLTWTSANEGIATVDSNGVVNGVAVGETIITASKTIGGNLVERTCTVIVANNVAEHHGTEADPFNVADAVQVAKGVFTKDPDGNPISLENEYYVKGLITETVNRTTTTLTFWIGDNSAETSAATGGLEVFKAAKVYGVALGTAYTDNTQVTRDFNVGNHVLVKSTFTFYKETTPETNQNVADIVYSDYIEARKYAAAFNAAFEAEGVCDAEGESVVETLASVWNEQSTAYSALDSDTKSILTSAEGSTKSSATDVEKCAAKYDYIGGKYQTQLGSEYDFMGRNPTPIASGRISNFSEDANNNTMIIVVVIASVSALAFTTLLVFKKKKQK